MPDISDLRSTIIPKSDQLNAEQLLTGPITITVTEVSTGNDEQPVSIHYEGESGRPYKPCKTMRKVLILAWGEDGREWAGKSMTLYCDPSVRFGGVDVGGIRISHMSHIDREKKLSLTATRGKKAVHTIQLLEVGPSLDVVLSAIDAATGKEGMAKAKALAEKLASPSDIEKAKEVYAAKAAALKTKAKPPSFADQIAAAKTLQDLQAIGEAMDVLPDGDEKEALTAQLLAREDELSPKA